MFSTETPRKISGATDVLIHKTFQINTVPPILERFSFDHPASTERLKSATLTLANFHGGGSGPGDSVCPNQLSEFSTSCSTCQKKELSSFQILGGEREWQP